MKTLLPIALLYALMLPFSHSIIAQGCWQQGEMVTYTQDAWGDFSTDAGSLLAASFNSVYPGDLVVGVTNRIILEDAASTGAFLPATGSPQPLPMVMRSSAATAFL